ncbi:Vesicle-associated membrane protein 3 [Triplophysa tibetana]|uniref:Vesicle-associated membrane protein 3 n=1 Tax=Triplophysa tibetana TaxID=1572043 RepID=A0A5A9N022_9TELE|nr:Vesicle-associated membrane protein 3 [Triplophysa tibetana]
MLRSAADNANPAGGEAGPPAAPPNTTSNRRLQQTQAQVDEVVDIMRVNVDKVLERDQKLSELDDRADALQAGASQFESCAAKLKNKYWWKNCKDLLHFIHIVHTYRDGEIQHQAKKEWESRGG